MIENMKILAMDVDGTLVPKGEMLPEVNKQALEELHKQGVLIGLASGRPFDRRLLTYAGNWGLSFQFDFIIGMNGGDLWKLSDNSVKHYYPMKKEWIREVLDLIKDFRHNAIVYADGYDRVCCSEWDEFIEMSQKRNHSEVEVGGPDLLAAEDTGKVEVHYYGEDHDALMAHLAAHPSKDWDYVITFLGTVEFQDKRINKGVALKELAKEENVPIENVVAFGDMDNDAGLLEASGFGVCLKNGSDLTKSKADDITKYNCEEGGLGQYLMENYINR